MEWETGQTRNVEYPAELTHYNIKNQETRIMNVRVSWSIRIETDLQHSSGHREKLNAVRRHSFHQTAQFLKTAFHRHRALEKGSEKKREN